VSAKAGDGKDANFLAKYLGGKSFLTPCTLSFNGKSFTTRDALVDTGADGYLFVNMRFGRKMRKYLGCEKFTDFDPGLIRGYRGPATELIDVVLRAHVTIENRTVRNEWLIVVDSSHDIIIGRKWFEAHDVLPDCKRRKLWFPQEWHPDPEAWKRMDISMDHWLKQGKAVPEEVRRAFEADIRHRNQLMEKEDQRRLAGRQAGQSFRPLAILQRKTPVLPAPPKPTVAGQEPRAKGTPSCKSELRPPVTPIGVTPAEEVQKAVQKRLSELESRQPAPALLRKLVIGKKKVCFDLPQGAPPVDHRDEGLAKMERSLRGLLPPPPPVEPETRVERRAHKAQEEENAQRHRECLPRVAVISAMAFNHIACRNKKSRHHAMATGITTLHEIDRILETKEALQSDDEDLRRQALEKVPACYREYLDVFSKADSDAMPPFRTGVDHKIELLPGAKPEGLGYTGLWKLSTEELEVARKYITENLEKGFIEPSSAPWAAPILFALKGDGSLRFCVDYRKLNAITKKDQYPLPLIDETLARIAKARIFTKIDIRQAFHRIRISPEAEDLTTFRTRYGAYKFKVLPFGLTNGPATFQRYINNTLMGYLDEFCSAYMDDILIFSETLEEHEIHVKRVLERLCEAGLQADLKKCEFHVTKTTFLGFVISTDGIRPDPRKLEAVRCWERPTTVKQVQSFLGFCNFYRRFVREYGRIARPLTNLTKKGVPFAWTEECQHAFEELKARLLEEPVLAHFHHDRPTRVETDASQGVVAGVMSQLQDDGQWHPVAFFSETMQGAEHNYPIHDKELMAVVRALQCWRAELIGLQTREPFLIVTDHQALEYFSTKRLLNIRQAGWAELMAQYNFLITYRPGSENAAADALSRKSEDAATQKEKREVYRTLQIFAPLPDDNQIPEAHRASLATIEASIMALDEDVAPPSGSGFQLVDDLLEANRMAPELAEWRQRAQAGDPDFSLIAGRLLLRLGKLVVPAVGQLRTRVIQEAHSRLVTAHPGQRKTKKLVTERYWWPRMAGDIDIFIDNCMPCRSSRHPRDKTPGLLRPIPPPDRAWQRLVMDFHEFPPDKYGFDNALVMIDPLSKTSWTIPCKKTATARDAARMYYEGPYRIHGLPQEVVSDRGPQFRADFTDEISRILGIEWKLASAGHSQTSGQVENLHQWVNQRLRPFISHYQDNWSRAIPALDAVQMGLPHDSTGLQPHEVLFGFPMPMPFDWESRTKDFADCTSSEELNRQRAQEAAQRIQGYVDYAREMIAKAQKKQAEQANRHRRVPDFDVGDRVVVIKQRETTGRPSDKLSFPVTQQHYEIVEKTDHGSFRLRVPESWRGSDIFPPDRLRKYPNNPLPGQEAENPPGEDVAGEEEWEVEKILASRTHYGTLQYQAQWRGWDPDPDWYAAGNFRNAPAALRRFHNDNPGKAGPPRRLDEWLLAAAEDRFADPHVDDNLPVAKGTPLRRSQRKK